jgi:death-on-curing protein
MTAWRWVPLNVALAIHDRQIAEHGGLSGVRDLRLVESALARPENLNSYSNPDSADLAAAYLFGLANNHGFADGNKRTAWVVARLFLMDNGLRLSFDPHEAITTVENVASGSLDEAGLAGWLRSRLQTP